MTRGRAWAEYKVRRVVEVEKLPSKADPAILLPWERLECGHLIRQPFDRRDKVSRLGALARKMAGHNGGGVAIGGLDKEQL